MGNDLAELRESLAEALQRWVENDETAPLLDGLDIYWSDEPGVLASTLTDACMASLAGLRDHEKFLMRMGRLG